MTTTLQSPFSNPANTPQPSVMDQYPQSGVPIPMNLSSLTPGMAAIQAYRARGGVPLGGRTTMAGIGANFGAPSGGNTQAQIMSAQNMGGEIPGTLPLAQNAAAAQRSIADIRPPTGYQTSNPGGMQTMGTSMGMPPIRMQGPPNAGGVRVGGIRPPNARAFNNRY